MNKIRIAGMVGESVVDGPGVRPVIFTQGCPRKCPGCHNEDLIPVEGGEDVDIEELANRVEEVLTPLTRGITFSGGEPLLQAEPLYGVIKLLKSRRPGLDVWVYTGYTYEKVRDLPVLELVDVLVDGPFEQESRDISLPFKGSRNQRLIDVAATRKAGRVVEWER